MASRRSTAWLVGLTLAACGERASGPGAPAAPATPVPASSAPAAPGLEGLSGAYRIHFRLLSEPCAAQATHDAIVDVAIAGTSTLQSMSWSERDDAAARASGVVDRASGAFTLNGAGSELVVGGHVDAAGLTGTRYYLFCSFEVTGAR